MDGCQAPRVCGLLPNLISPFIARCLSKICFSKRLNGSWCVNGSGNLRFLGIGQDNIAIFHR